MDVGCGEAWLSRSDWLLSMAVCSDVCPILWDYKCLFSPSKWRSWARPVKEGARRVERAKFCSENGTALGQRDWDASRTDPKNVHSVTPALIAGVGGRENGSMRKQQVQATQAATATVLQRLKEHSEEEALYTSGLPMLLLAVGWWQDRMVGSMDFHGYFCYSPFFYQYCLRIHLCPTGINVPKSSSLTGLPPAVSWGPGVVKAE